MYIFKPNSSFTSIAKGINLSRVSVFLVSLDPPECKRLHSVRRNISTKKTPSEAFPFAEPTKSPFINQRSSFRKPNTDRESRLSNLMGSDDVREVIDV